MSDVEDCASYLRKTRSTDWKRFDAAVEDFLARHRSKLAERRRELAEAYRVIAPEDSEGLRRIES